MNVSIIIPMQASDSRLLLPTLDAIEGQRYDAGRLEVLVAQYGAGAAIDIPVSSFRHQLQVLGVAHASPYAARNLAASESTGDILVFTEPGCVPEPEWVGAHVARLSDAAPTVR